VVHTIQILSNKDWDYLDRICQIQKYQTFDNLGHSDGPNVHKEQAHWTVVGVQGQGLGQVLEQGQGLGQVRV
jgi:hypothetical protein